MTEILHRALKSVPTPDILYPRIPKATFLLDAITEQDGTMLYLNWEPKELAAFQDFRVEDVPPPYQVRSLARGARIFLPNVQRTEIALSLGGAPVRVECAPVEPEVFSGLNTLFAIVEDPDPQVIADWAQYHVTTQGAEAVLLLFRATPKGDSAALREILKAALQTVALKAVMVVDCPVPLGAKTPAARDLVHAPDAPGRQVVDESRVDPWTAPFSELAVLRVVMDRFLTKARAVLFCQVSDLVSVGQRSVFESSTEDAGFVSIKGRYAYPYSLRNVEHIRHAHHGAYSFDGAAAPAIWCFNPAQLTLDTIFRLHRVSNAAEAAGEEVFSYWRCMGLNHPGVKAAELAPRSSLVGDDALEAVVQHLPPEKRRALAPMPTTSKLVHSGKVMILSTMKNEGPFILEWIAFHRALGITDFLIYSNDCTDGTDTLLDLLQEKGLLAHRENPFRETKERPQHAALFDAQVQEITQDAEWVIPMDVDEFINIHTGDGSWAALMDAVPQATMISMTWRLFGNADVTDFKDEFITEAFTQAAPKLCRKPHQAWGFKTAFRNLGHYKKFGVHRPKGLLPEYREQIHWVNGSGQEMPLKILRSGWRSSSRTIGYDLVTLNHYALRSAESFLVKRDRGRVNHVDRDQGLDYWFRMNHNKEPDHSIQKQLPRARAEFARLMSDPQIAAQHRACVAAHQKRIQELRAQSDYAAFFDEITSDRLRALSRMLEHFGTEVFLKGPDAVPLDFHLTDAGT